jgi:formylglycine-generating enzyme required for sulfatase activity
VWVKGFWMGRYEVTQAQWIAVMGRLPEYFGDTNNLGKEDDLPVTCVTWFEAQEFIDNLNKLLKLDKRNGYSLPREAEWEYAARGGTTTPFPYGPTITPDLENYSWANSYADGPTKTREYNLLMKVGSFVANPFGLYDMLGNAGEWCEDWYGEYPTARDGEHIDPTGPAEGEKRVRRGGSYSSPPRVSRPADRGWAAPNDNPGTFVGFRLVRRQ